MNTPIFSEQTRKRLKLHKYGKWGVDLSEEHVEAIVVGLGEIGARGSRLTDALENQQPMDSFDLLRGIATVKALEEFVMAVPKYDVVKFEERWHSHMKELTDRWFPAAKER